MALNKFMHERNPYKNRRPDFKALALKYEKFRKVATGDLRGSVTLDFKKPECLQALSWALLKEHHDLDVDIPTDRLIPTIPLRLNYILWLEDLLDRKQDGVHGIDIGTGASCVYALLGAKENRWRFLATESDDTSFSYAKHNVARNNLQDNITVVKVEPKEILAAPLAATDPDRKYDFCMCNPPFFSSSLEAWGMTASRSDDRPEPKSVSTANESESIFPGGEVEFVRHMIADSLVLKDRVRIYTTMLGKKTSVSILKEDLRRNKVTQVGMMEFCQGRTMRWGLAWTFDPTVKFPGSRRSQVRGSKPLIYKVPPSLESCPDVVHGIQGIGQKLQSIFDDLKITYSVKYKLSSKWQWKVRANENTWSHQRRRRRKESLKAANRSAKCEGECVPREAADTGRICAEGGSGRVCEEKGIGRVCGEELGNGRICDEKGTGRICKEKGTIRISEEKGTGRICEEKGTGRICEKEGNGRICEETGSGRIDKAAGTSKASETKRIDDTARNETGIDLGKECRREGSIEQTEKLIYEPENERDRADNGGSVVVTMDVECGQSVKRPHSDGDDDAVCAKRPKHGPGEERAEFPAHKQEADSVARGSDSTGVNQDRELCPDSTHCSAVSTTCIKDSDLRKVDSDNSVPTESTSIKESADKRCDKDECLLSCDVSVHKEVSGIVIQMDWIEGSDKESMQQVMQHVRNRIK